MVGEVHELNYDKLDWTRRSVIVLGKGNKKREVYFAAKAVLWLRRYLNARGDSCPALFVTDHRLEQKDGNLSRQCTSISQMQRVFKRVAARCDLEKRVTPHVLRHTLATLLLNQDAPIAAVQSVLGHASPALRPSLR